MTPKINQVITTSNWKDIAENALRDKTLTPIGRSYLHTLLGAPAELAATESDFVAKLLRARFEAEGADLSKCNFSRGEHEKN